MFEPDFRNIVAAANNQRPKRLPLYEHIICPTIMEKILDVKFAEMEKGDSADLDGFFAQYCRFWKEMTYDTVSYEVCVTEILPGGGALLAETIGVIQNRADFEAYPWSDLPRIFWETAGPRFDALAKNMPTGMKAIGGVGNGVFETSEDLVGFEQLCYMQLDDPELFADLFKKIGDLQIDLWKTLLDKYHDLFCVCRTGDDMGYKSQTLLAPEAVITHIVPQYSRITRHIHNAGRPYLLHSCGCIFDVMEHIIGTGIDAKHSNEDVIAAYDRWIEDYGDCIGMFGGIDTDRVCRMKPDDLYKFVIEEGTRFRTKAKGFALGSGNSIPDYVPVDGYLAMVKAAQEIRKREAGSQEIRRKVAQQKSMILEVKASTPVQDRTDKITR